MSKAAASTVTAAWAATKRRRGALTNANRHWTDALAESEHATTRLGARFHLRKLFLRASVDEFSQSELEFITQYLVNETTISEQPWWAALTLYEQLEIVNMLVLHHVVKGEDQTMWFSSRETAKDCILLYGSAEAKPVDPSFGPTLKFTEGSVVGNMRLPSSSLSFTGSPSQSDGTMDKDNSLPAVVVSADASPDVWRRVKREQAFRNRPHLYNKLRIIGPADFFILTSTDIARTTSKAAERLEREELLRLYGLERFLGCIRKKTFESGAVLTAENDHLDALYFILEGECRASVSVNDVVNVDPFAEQTNAANTAAADAMLNGHRTTMPSPRRLTQLPIASLGPRSLVGDISMLLGLREPATIQAVTAVVVLAVSQEDYAKEVGDLKDAEVAAPIEIMKKVALETMGFVLERVKAEAAYHNCDQSKKIRAMERSIAKKQAEFDTPQSRHLLQVASFIRPAPYASVSSPGKRPPPMPLKTEAQPTPSSGLHAKIPSVVQAYVETAASRKGQVSAGASLAPVVLSKRRDFTLGDGSPTYVTREQRKGLFILNGLNSPLTNKSLWGQSWSPSSVLNRRDEDTDDSSEASIRSEVEPQTQETTTNPAELQRDRRRPAMDDHLFLFPTVTRQRQLHARSLPLLPKYRGVEASNNRR